MIKPKTKATHLEWWVPGEGVEVGGLHADDLAVRERLEPGSTPRRAHAALRLARKASFVVSPNNTYRVFECEVRKTYSGVGCTLSRKKKKTLSDMPPQLRTCSGKNCRSPPFASKRLLR